MLLLPKSGEGLTETVDPPELRGWGFLSLPPHFFLRLLPAPVRGHEGEQAIFYFNEGRDSHISNSLPGEGLKTPLSTKFKIKQITAHTKELSGMFSPMFSSLFVTH